jgi:flagellar hook-length control protein FliK
MNPLVSGTGAGSFTASLMAISAPAETLNLDGNQIQISDLKQLLSGEEGFPELLDALREVLPEAALEQIETLVENGNGLPQAVAELTDSDPAGAIFAPPVVAISLARQLDQSPAKPLVMPLQPMPQQPPQPQPQTQTMMPSLLPAASAQLPTAGESPVAMPALAAESPPAAQMLLPEAVRAIARNGEGRSEPDPMQMIGRASLVESESGVQTATVSLLKAMEGAAALRPAAPTPMTLETPVGARGWEQGLGERVLWMLGNSIQSASLRLNPAHLGPIEIQVSVQQEQASVTFTAQHAPVREALEMSLPRLREMFVENNLQLANVDVGQRGQSGQSGGGFAQGSGDQSARLGDDGFTPADRENGEGEVATRLASDGLLDDYA